MRIACIDVEVLGENSVTRKMGACSSQSATEQVLPPNHRTPSSEASSTTTPFIESLLEVDSDAPAQSVRWNTRRRRRRRQQLRDEARLAEIVALQQSLAAMEDFFQSLLGQAHLYMEAMDPQVGGNAGPPPASEDAINALPSVTVDPHMQCGICGEAFEDGAATKLPCGHLFHTSTCIEPWLSRHCTCPVCRYELPTEDAAFEAGREERMSTRKISAAEEDEEYMLEMDRKDGRSQQCTREPCLGQCECHANQDMAIGDNAGVTTELSPSMSEDEDSCYSDTLEFGQRIASQL